MPIAIVELFCGESVELATEDVSVAPEEGLAELPVLTTDNDELPALVVTAEIGEVLLDEAEVVSAGTPVAP